CAGADGACPVPMLRLGGDRNCDQAGLVLLERSRATTADEDHRAADGLPRQYLRRREPVGETRYACGLWPAARTFQAHGTPPLLPRPRSRRDRTRIFHAHGAGARHAYSTGGPRHHRRLLRRAGHGGWRSDRPAAGYFEQIQAVLRKYDILFVADE